MLIGILQIPSIGMSSTKLYHYIRIAHNKNIELLVLGEYLLNSFFKELETMSIDMIKEQSIHYIKILRELSTKYQLVIVAPLIVVKKKQPYKTVVRFSPNSTSYYYQQILINYSHWNERKFFANYMPDILYYPLVFRINGLKFAIISGFEIHIDKIWLLISKKNIDAVIMPCSSTFESASRWKSIAITRAITHNCYILRANRIGEYMDGDYVWRFYGDSFVVDPNGEQINHLGNTEELMIEDISHLEVIKARRVWGFRDLNKKYF